MPPQCRRLPLIACLFDTARHRRASPSVSQPVRHVATCGTAALLPLFLHVSWKEGACASGGVPGKGSDSLCSSLLAILPSRPLSVTFNAPACPAVLLPRLSSPLQHTGTSSNIVLQSNITLRCACRRPDHSCRGCVQVSVRHKAQCPVCKAKVGRRDVSGDDTMDRVVKVRYGAASFLKRVTPRHDWHHTAVEVRVTS